MAATYPHAPNTKTKTDSRCRDANLFDKALQKLDLIDYSKSVKGVLHNRKQQLVVVGWKSVKNHDTLF
jgi:hypothetical protein